MGVIGVRTFRPFPARTIAQATAKADGIIVLEKAISYGYEGALATELKGALFSHNGHRPLVYNYILGLGGKDVNPSDLLEAAKDTMQGFENGQVQEHPLWIGSGI